MTPEEAQAINSRLDKFAGDVNGRLDGIVVSAAQTATDVAEVKSDLRNHIARGEELSTLRATTCPNNGAIAQLTSDVNALAGFSRKHHERLMVLEGWHEEQQKHELVETTVWGERLGPLKALAAEIGKGVATIVVAVLVAYLLISWGLK